MAAKVGKKPSVPVELQMQEFEANLSEIIVNGKFVKSSANIFGTMATTLKMTKQAVYLAVKRFVISKYPSAIETTFSSSCEIVDDDCDPEYLPSDKFVVSKDQLKFTVDIEGHQIFPIEKDDKENDWKNLVIGIIWEFSRLPCGWSFERYREVCNEANIYAKCSIENCNATLFAYTECNKRKLTILIKSYRDKKVHDNSIRLNKSWREKIVAMTKSDANCVVHAKLADELMLSGDLLPGHLPKLRNVAQIKHSESKKECLDDIPIIALRKMKDSPQFRNCIGDIGLDPFYCVYFTELQREWQRIEIARRRCIVSIDSTGL